MATRLPWFPFYVNDWIDDERVLALNNEQRGIYLWLLCRQWMIGDLPYDVGDVYALMPPNTNTAATSYVFLSFFPADPDTNRRANPKLAQIRADQEAQVESNRSRTAKARASVTRTVTDPVTATKTEAETKPKKDGEASTDLPSVLPPEVGAALQPFLKGDATQRRARIGAVQMLLEGMRGPAIAPDAVARGLGDMVASNVPFTPNALKGFARKAVGTLQGEAGARAAQEALKPQSSVLRQPDANQMPSEDEL